MVTLQIEHQYQYQYFSKSNPATLYTGWPNKNRTFLRFHIFAATTYIITRFLLKCSEISAENNKRNFFKQLLNMLCKLTGNGLHHARLLDNDQPGLG